MSHDLNGTAPKAVKRTSEDLLREVDELNEGVKALALNLAIYLAKARSRSKGGVLDKLEPEFIRLVNGAVKAVQEMASLLNAARNSETMVFDPPGSEGREYELDVKLQAIAMQCNKILSELK